MKPLFISIEGTEGSGKSTMLPYIQSVLQKTFTDVRTTRAPGGTEIGQAVRDIVKKNYAGEKLAPESLLMLMLVDRLQLIDTVIAPWMLQGSVVITDRYLDSTEVLQCDFGKMGSLYNAVCDTASLERLSIRPDYTLFFKTSPEVGRKRLGQRSLPLDGLDDMFSSYRAVQAWGRHFEELRTVWDKNRIYTIETDPPFDMTPAQSISHVKEQIDNAMLSIVGHWQSEYGYTQYSFIDEWQACSKK